MCAEKSVAIVGHSLVPRDVGTVDGAKITTYRCPGAKASSFESSPLSRVLQWPHDLTILFIGGNDVFDGCIPRNIAQDIEAVVESIHAYCHSHIALVLLEHRNPPLDNRFNVTPAQYRKVVNNINGRLKRKYRAKPYVQFLSVGAKPFQHGVTDEIHFNKEAQFHLRLKFRNAIRYFVQNNQ